MICTDPGLASIGMTDKIRDLISNEIAPTFFEETPANPTEKAVEDALNLYKKIIVMEYWIWGWIQYGFRKSRCYDGKSRGQCDQLCY